MKKQTLLLMFIAASIAASVGCTSKKVDDEAAEANELTGTTTSEAEGDAGLDEFGAEEEVASEGSDQSVDEFGGEPTDEAAAEAPVEDDAAVEPPAEDLATLEDDVGGGDGLDEMAASDAPADTGTSDFSSDELSGLSDPSTDTSTEAPADTGMSDMGYSDPAPTGVPLKKMQTTPWTKNGVLLNTIYIAREGDTLSSIASKIYGMDKSEELRSVNGHVANRDVVVGDKIYFNSPNRPTDNTQLITYYEDLNLQPEIYPAQAGENIRAIGKKLLGHENSWKEIWATNMDVESKDVLASEVSLRYWTGGGTPAPITTAQTSAMETPPPPPNNQLNEAPPPPMPEEFAQNAPPPPPDFETAPPPAMEPPPPPEMTPPPVMNEAQKLPEPAAEGGPASLLDDPDQTMALAAGIILLTAALALIIIIRKKKRANRGIDFHTATHTQIE